MQFKEIKNCMKYCFQLLPHANSHYRKSQENLGAHELGCMLSAFGLDPEIRLEMIGGSAFFTFENDPLPAAALQRLAQHSSLLLMAQEENGLLRPLDALRQDYLPREVSEVLKYKGKTSATFTRMLINCALSAAGITDPAGKTLVDPLCGRGTSCLCALEMGMNASGIDLDKNDLNELINYFVRYMTRGRYKHKLTQAAETCGKKNVPTALFTLADTKEHFLQEDVRRMKLYLADTTMAGSLLQKHPADILVADLPYGIQHAPQDGKRAGSFDSLLVKAMPSWHKALKKGGAMALSFNRLTTKPEMLAEACGNAGFRVLTGGPWQDNAHFVETAVTRDLLVAVAE